MNIVLKRISKNREMVESVLFEHRKNMTEKWIENKERAKWIKKERKRQRKKQRKKESIK